MELRKYLELFWGKKGVIILTTIVTMVVVATGTYMMTPIYQASALLRIAAATGGSIDYSNYMYIDRLQNTYVEIITSKPILDELDQRLNLNESPKKISVEILPNTELLKITVEDTNPIIAAQVANTLLDILIEQSEQLYSGSGKTPVEILAEQLAQTQIEIDRARQVYENLVIQSLKLTPTISATPTINISPTITLSSTTALSPTITLTSEVSNTVITNADIDAADQALKLKQETYAMLLSQYDQARIRESIRANMLSVVDPAVVPEIPSKPRVVLNLALGLIVGMIGGAGLALFFEYLDPILYTTEQIEALTGLTTLARIPKINKKQTNISQDGFSIKAEAFRNLRTKIQLIDRQRPIKILLMISAEPDQGKSMIVANLAFSLSEAGKRVLAIDSDLRLPKLHKFTVVPNKMGLTEVLDEKIEIEEAIQKSLYNGLFVLTSGSRPDDPAILLGSPQMETLIKSAGQLYDYILIDTPALIAAADVAMLTHMVDGLILVVKRGYAKRKAVELAAKFLEGYPEKTLGVVVNHSEPSENYYDYRRKPTPAKTKEAKIKQINGQIDAE
jgi:capsular exopolysaccharide synthesis family protein